MEQLNHVSLKPMDGGDSSLSISRRLSSRATVAA
jgi:hypothetical protein